ncbi:MAG: hypothetical protein K0R03_1342 [Moraxellaceae bacterium]|jgi:hypothetical protein|nr:hypothetical protein [Moraxellaceae bacterium]
MAKSPHPQAQLLLEAHVEYILAQLGGQPLEELIESLVDQLFENARKITLDEAVTREMIKATARGYAVELELSGAIPELVGDIARSLYAHPIHARTRVSELLSDGLFSEFLDKILEMRDLHQWIVHEAVTNPVYAALASELLMEGLRGYARQGSDKVRDIPGLRKAGRLANQTILRAALPLIEETLEESLRKYIQRSLQGLLDRSENFLLGLFDEEKIRTLVLDAWDIIKHKRISEFKEGVSSLDIEEFFVIGYEAWRELRATPIYGALIDSGIDCFFDKYGDTTLSEILEEMGVTREIAIRDANRFAPPVLAMLRRKKLLQPFIQEQLAGFYASPAVAGILAAPATAPATTAKTPAKPAATAKAAAAPKVGRPADKQPAAKKSTKAAGSPTAKKLKAGGSAPKTRKTAKNKE